MIPSVVAMSQSSPLQAVPSGRPRLMIITDSSERLSKLRASLNVSEVEITAPLRPKRCAAAAAAAVTIWLWWTLALKVSAAFSTGSGGARAARRFQCWSKQTGWRITRDWLGCSPGIGQCHAAARIWSHFHGGLSSRKIKSRGGEGCSDFPGAKNVSRLLIAAKPKALAGASALRREV